VYARTQLAELLIFEDRASEAASVVDATIRALPKNAVPYVIRARLESHAGRLDNAKSAVKDGLELDPHEPVLNQFAQRLKQGEKLPLKSQAFRTVGKGAQTKDVIAAVSDADLAEVLRIGTMRQLRFRLEFARGDEHQRAVKELQKILREDPTFAYAELLAARHRVWEAKAVVLPSFAAAFEDALATEDRENLERLARRQPRLEALILVAQALLGDAEAQRKTELWLREPQIADKEPAIAGLHSDLRRVLRVIEGGRSLKDAFT
jgi:tetratricopeptide (TPR) repeat protein